MKKLFRLLFIAVVMHQANIMCDNYGIHVHYNVNNTMQGQLKATMNEIQKAFKNKNKQTLDEYVKTYYKPYNKLHLYDKSDILHVVPSGYIANGQVCLSNGTLLGTYAGSFGERPQGEDIKKIKLAIQMIGTDLSWHNFPVFITNPTPAAANYIV